jgi:plasmid stabilization system protein ParE
MPYVVRITPRALVDVDEILSWLAERSPQPADRWYAALVQRVRDLEVNPQRWPLAHESHQLGFELREVLFGKRQGVYRILFTVEGDMVHVHHVRRVARDWLKPHE